MVEINGIKYEIIYSYYPPQSPYSVTQIRVPIMLKKVDGEVNI